MNWPLPFNLFIRKTACSFRRNRTVRLYVSDLLNLGSTLAFYRVVRLSRYDAGVWAVIAGAPQLFRMTFTHANGLNPALLPANYDCGSVVAVEPVMCRISLRVERARRGKSRLLLRRQLDLDLTGDSTCYVMLQG